MVDIKPTSVTIGGRSYNKDKSGYPELPTVFSGVDITWGAGSCIEHPEASRAQISLWVPKTDAAWIPTLGEVVEVRGGNVTAGVTADLSLFAGKVESVKLQDDHEGLGYRVNIVAADALAEAARLRLSDTPWPFEDVTARQSRIAVLATKAGVAFNAGLTVEQGYAESLETSVRARDIDSFPALEIFQRTTMAAGHTVISVVNIVQPSWALSLPEVLILSGSNVMATEAEGVVNFDAAHIQDDTFELDTSRVINELKVEMTRFIGTAGPPGWETSDEVNASESQIFTDTIGSRKTTPQTRSLATDWAIRDGFMEDLLPLSVMVTKGRLLLAGQSQAQWRLSSALTPVLPEIPEQAALRNLLLESTRFGALIRLDNTSDLIPKYMRVRGGRIVLGDNPLLEFDLEPVEYSAPLPLSRNTLYGDATARPYTIGKYLTLTPNDLRTIGAR